MLLFASLSYAQIVPDRPGYADSVHTVIPLHYQLEIGIDYTVINQAITGPSIPGRLGLTENFELRMAIPEFGFGFSQGPFGFSLVPAVTFPALPNLMPSGDFGTSLGANWEAEATRLVSFSGNVLGTWEVVGTGYRSLSGSVALGLNPDIPVGFYGEGIALIDSYGLSTAAGAGLAWQTSPTGQFDFSVTIPLSGPSFGIGIGIGSSVLW